MIKRRRAFTLLEILITIALTMVILAIALPISFSQSSSATLQEILSDLHTQLFNQQQSAYARKSNSSYGIYFYSNQFTTYTGTSLSGASDTYATTFPNGITITEFNLNNSSHELYFPSGSFRANTYGKVKISLNSVNYYFEINPEGLIYYYKV